MLFLKRKDKILSSTLVCENRHNLSGEKVGNLNKKHRKCKSFYPVFPCLKITATK